MNKNYCAQIVENIVTQIIVSDFDWATTSLEGTWYDLGSNFHEISIGYTYNKNSNVFIAPQPYASWSLDANNDWQAPTPKPEGRFYWDEESLSWLAIPVG
jgi:hypothetical protein